MKKRLADKTVVVVGAGTIVEDDLGNGKAAAIQFAREGAEVLCVDIKESAVKITADMIRDEGGQAEFCVADVTDINDCKHVVETCLREFKKIDVLHNNVGIGSGKEIVDTDEEGWSKTFDVNVKGMFQMSKHVIPHMVEKRCGSIINVSSIASIRPLPDAAYCSSKGAVDSLTKYIAARYGRYNIRANVLMLGYIDTPLARPVWENDKIREINLRQVPMRRFASPWEIAKAAVFLASDDASYVNGIVLPVDGGLCSSL